MIERAAWPQSRRSPPTSTLLLARKPGLETPVHAIRRAAGRYCETHRVHSMPCATSRCTGNDKLRPTCDFVTPGLSLSHRNEGGKLRAFSWSPWR
jgi:hypothetical protein